MSKVQLQGNVSGTGIFTIASPNSNIDRTLTLPDNTGTLLTTSSAVTRTQLPAGTVLQVVSANYNLDTTIASSTPTSYASVSITPTSATSKILLLATVSSIASNAAASAEFEARIYKNGVTFVGVEGLAAYGLGFNANQWRGVGAAHAQYLDSPATTSAITYALYLFTANTEGVRINTEIQSPGQAGTGIIAMEIAA